jgi:hypothetical protein
MFSSICVPILSTHNDQFTDPWHMSVTAGVSEFTFVKTGTHKISGSEWRLHWRLLGQHMYYLKFYVCLNLIFLRQVLFRVAKSVWALLNLTFSAL